MEPASLLISLTLLGPPADIFSGKQFEYRVYARPVDGQKMTLDECDKYMKVMLGKLPPDLKVTEAKCERYK